MRVKHDEANRRGHQSCKPDPKEECQGPLARVGCLEAPHGRQGHEDEDDVDHEVERRDGAVEDVDVEAFPARYGLVPEEVQGATRKDGRDGEAHPLKSDEGDDTPDGDPQPFSGEDAQVEGQDRVPRKSIGRHKELQKRVDHS